MEVVIITGMSGAGKSRAAECLEDEGYYCIDNMPPILIKNFLTLTMERKSKIDRVAFVMDIRGAEKFGSVDDAMEDLQRYDVDYKIIFLEASDVALMRRYDETRRVHPTTKQTVTEEAITKERKILASIREKADFVLDTSEMNTAALKHALLELLNNKTAEETFVINIMSFGFKHGVPATADMMFDMRFIPNPYYKASLRPFSGNNVRVRSFVMNQQTTKTFLKNLNKMVNDMIPGYMREGKFNLNIAFGCTGGKHRSVAVANEAADLFKQQDKQVTLKHRDIGKK